MTNSIAPVSAKPAALTGNGLVGAPSLRVVIDVASNRKARRRITDTTNHMHADQPASTRGSKPTGAEAAHRHPQ